MAEGGSKLSLLPHQRIVKQGWLSKRGEYIRNWRQRYFYLLDDGMLLGFKTVPEEDLSNPLNDFTVKGCQTLTTDIPKPNTFIIRGLHWTSVIERSFNAQSKEERNAWVEAIERVKESISNGDGGLSLGGVKSSEEEEDKDNDDSGDPDANSGVEYLPAPQGTTAMGPYKKKKKLSLDSFELLSGLGKGTFGRVVLAREKSSGNIYAIKMLRKDVILEKDEVEHTLTENRVLQRIDHPFLMYLKYSFTTKDRLCFVLEYVTGGELFHHLTKESIFSEERTKFYGAEICLALGYLHHCSIIYRDLKLENLLLDAEGHIKVADFGLCKENMSYGNTTRTFCGTPEYLAPEVGRSNPEPPGVLVLGYRGTVLNSSSQAVSFHYTLSPTANTSDGVDGCTGHPDQICDLTLFPARRSADTSTRLSRWEAISHDTKTKNFIFKVLEENDYGRTVDWWGYGVCLYEMMVGRLPFFDQDHERLFQLIVYGEARFPRTISAEARDMLKSLLVKNPLQRLGGGVRDALEVQEHPFYNNVNWDHVLNKKIPPPFVPEVRSSTDTGNYDPEFTTPVHITPPGSQSSLIVIPEQDEHFIEFDQFSYQGDSSTIGSSLTSSFNSLGVARESS
ncbi:Pleckstrin domain [Trinorchestia longiramus]|nr:Pleckstrin domain [Trinorchestia longiramus]